MTDHVSIWDTPSEQQQTDRTASTTTASDSSEPKRENPIAAAIAVSDWSRDDVELALQVLNLLLLAYFVVQWRKIHV